MYPSIRAVLARTGLITNQQAQAAGLSEDQIRVLLRSGAWVIVRRGVYAERELWDSLDEHRGRPRLRAHAAHLTMVTDHVMSHESAALWLDLAFLKPDRELVHITRPDVRGSRTTYGVKHHGAVFRDEQVVTADGVPVLDLARTAIDIGREHGYLHCLVACDAALQRGVTRAQLEAAHGCMDNWPNIRPVRAAVADSDPGAESVGETLGRDLVAELGLGLPITTQFPVQLAGGRVAWVDMVVGLHGFEFDGKIKVLGRELGGVADRSASEVVWEERKREKLVCAEGLGISRITWDDLWGKGRAQARVRLRREYDITVRRFGTQLPERLARFAARHRPSRVPQTG